MRVHLSRILAINWYGYRDFIDVSGLTLITGANGSGKSALLDLLQFVMLGESQSRFNKAAAGAGSGRTLRGYCLCDTNTTGKDGQERFLRPSGVTLAALEFVWPSNSDGSEARRETWGARIEYEGPTAKPRTLWFYVPGRLEKDDFLAPQLLDDSLAFLSEEEFRVHLKRDLEGDAWDRQATYLDEMALRNHLGFDRVQMNKTLPNSMAFQPVESFEKFIRDYLLETGLPDVKAVRASVDAHRRTREKLDRMHDQHQRLKRICDCHSAYLEAKKQATLFSHLRQALAHEDKLEALQSRRSKLEQLRRQNSEHQADHDAAVIERNELDEQLAAVRLVAGKDLRIVHLAQSRESHARLTDQIEKLREAAKAAREFLHGRTQQWKQWLRNATDLGLDQPEQAGDWMKQMQGADEAAALDAATRMARIYQILVSDGEEKLRPIDERIKDLDARDSRLKRELDDLANKGSTFSSPLLDALRSRGQKAVALGRVIEVKPDAEPWWPLLETLLGPNRQAVLAEDFTAAWDQAQRLGHIDEPLVNPTEIKAGTKAKPGSVAGLFDTSYDPARAYLEHLYGDLVTVEKIKQLDKHPRALSKDGWLKDPPLRLHLTPSKEFTIGEEGLRRLRTLREEEQEAVKEELSRLNRSRDDWKMWLHRGKQWNLDQADPPTGTSGLRDLPRLKKEAQQLDETIRLLATPEREATVEKLRVLESTFRGTAERVVRLKTSLELFVQQERELTSSIETATEEEQVAQQDRWSSREKLEGVMDAEIDALIESAKSQFLKWSQRIEVAAEVARTHRDTSITAVDDRNRERLALAEKHPDTSDYFDPSAEDNLRYDSRRRELEEHELPRFQREAEDAEREWEDRLQHQVLDVLKEKLDEAERTKKDLNRAMDHVIGGMRYQLSMRADRTHSAIWTLVDKGLNPSMELFAAGGKEDIARAKQALMAAIENEEDPRQQKALDYRYYHHWDIHATPAGKGEGAAISLNKSAKKQSGGENQAPFFVAMLAAFQRVYDLGKKDQRRNLGLVVMDEAFSKLSGDRIDACLDLARNFGLQLVMAFPEDRLPTMIQHAETVVQAKVERTYDQQSENLISIRNWCIRVDRKRLIDALS